MACSKSYKTSETFRGLLFIINNVKFHKTSGMKNRDGSEKDVERLKKTFGQLGFEIKCEENRTCDQMISDVETVAFSDLAKYDCLIVALLTHGEDNNIVCGVGPKVDQRKIDEILKPLKDVKKAKAKAKEIQKEMPILVFVQACRGHDLDRGHNVQADDVVSNNKTDTDCIRVPIEADFLYHYSSSPGYYSFRTSKKGSVFIQAICDVYDECIKEGAEIDVLKSHLEVNGRVAVDFKSYMPNDPAFHNMKQMPSLVCTLRKSLYLKKHTA